jgi:hypothetical protein
MSHRKGPFAPVNQDIHPPSQQHSPGMAIMSVKDDGKCQRWVVSGLRFTGLIGDSRGSEALITGDLEPDPLLCRAFGQQRWMLAMVLLAC